VTCPKEKIQGFFRRGLVIIGDLPRGGIQILFRRGLIVIGELPR
jgi:hypothetical protein